MSNPRRRVKKKCANSKRGNTSQDPFVPGASKTQRFDSTWLTLCRGQTVQVYWPLDKAYYTGKVTKVQLNRKEGKSIFVQYPDGDKEWLDLSRERYRFPRPDGDDNDDDEDEDEDEDDDVDVRDADSGQDSEMEESDSKSTSHTKRNLKRKRPEGPHDESEEPRKKKKRQARGRPKGPRKRPPVENDSDSDSPMNDQRASARNSRVHTTSGSSNGNVKKNTSKNGSHGYGERSDGNGNFMNPKQHSDNTNHAHDTLSSQIPMQPSVALEQSNQVAATMFGGSCGSLTMTPHERVAGMHPTMNAIAGARSDATNLVLGVTAMPHQNGLSSAGLELHQKISSDTLAPNGINHQPMISSTSSVDAWIDKHVSVLDNESKQHDAVVIAHRNIGNGHEFQVQYDDSDVTFWVSLQHIREQVSTESPKGKVNGYVLALDNSQWFKGVVEDILAGVNGPIFRIAFPQFDSSPFMYFPDRRVKEYNMEEDGRP